MDQQVINNLEKSYSLIVQANNDMIYIWSHHVLFTWRWWISLAFTIIPWVIWIVKRKKESTHRLLYAAFFTMLISSWFDVLGILFGLWSYHFELVPFSPAFLPWDITFIPVTTIAFLQYKPHINPFIKAVVFSGIGSFLAQPTFVVLGYYAPKHWEHYYSFPILLVIYLLANYFATRNHFENL
jgi:hypothetical protein